MNTEDNRPLSSLGLLRITLLALSLANLLPPLGALLAGQAGTATEGFWPVVSGLISPVMAPLLLVVILFDYIMSRVRAADAEGIEREGFARIARIELAVMAINLLFWVPYFTMKLS